MKCPLKYICKCPAQVKIITRKDYKRLEFFGTHDEHSHAEDKSKNLKHDQIVTIYYSVMVPPLNYDAI